VTDTSLFGKSQRVLQNPVSHGSHKTNYSTGSRESGCDPFNALYDCCFGLYADNAVQLSPAFQQQQRRNALDAEAAAVAGFSSTFSFATRTRPAISAASSSITGATIPQGPHHGAHMSSNTGSGERSTSAAKLASVTFTGLFSKGKVVLHRPHTG
jgi:hypothetical protein